MKTKVLSATWQLDHTEEWCRATIFWDKSLLEIEEDICPCSWQRVCKVTNIIDLGYILSFLIESLNLVYYDLVKQLSLYFIFLFGLTTRKECGKVSHNRSQVKVMSHDECGKVVHRPCSRCISSVQKLNKNSIEFSLSTQTKSAVKSS